MGADMIGYMIAGPAELVRDKARGVGTLYLRPEQGPDSIFTVDVSAKSITTKKCICALCAM